MRAIAIGCERCGIPLPEGTPRSRLYCPVCSADETESDATTPPPLYPSTPDFSHLRASSNPNLDSALDDPEDGDDDSVIGNSVRNSPSNPPPTMPIPTVPVVFTPVGVNPFADLTPPEPSSERDLQPTLEMQAPPAPTLNWQLPVLVALAIYAFVATVLAIWGWARKPISKATAPERVAQLGPLNPAESG